VNFQSILLPTSWPIGADLTNGVRVTVQ
jgi:hypothetical protein